MSPDICEHDWADYEARSPEGAPANTIFWRIDTFSQWIRLVSVRQCRKCYRLALELDHVPGEQFMLRVYTQGLTPPAD